MSQLLSRTKHIVNQFLRTVGHRIDHESIIPSFDRLASDLKRTGLSPSTIIDAGVATGTPWLYNAFPKAKYFLVDPTPQSLPFMQAWAERLNAEIMNLALGNFSGSIKIKVRPEHSGSSIFEEVGDAEILEEVEAPVRRFDALMKEFARPALMKIDVQGAELLVLEGIGGRMKDLDCIIVETSLIATLKGSPEFAQIVALMKASDFVLFDITGVARRPLDQALAQVDAVFVPEDSPLRKDRRWSA